MLDFVDKTSAGYFTPLGKEWKNGIEISGGQWQRLALARCFFRQSSVILLDEPFSSIDSRTAHSTMKAINKLYDSALGIIISHQNNFFLHTKNILVLQKGCLVATGSHDDLMNKNETYTELFKDCTEKSSGTE